MSFSIVPLLLHSEHVPAEARQALRAAGDAPLGERRPLLERAARVLHVQANVDCRDARELVGLPDGSCA